MKSSSGRSPLPTERAHCVSTDQGTLFALIGALFVFLIWGRYRYDLVALARC
jgi:hypothetical protein